MIIVAGLIAGFLRRRADGKPRRWATLAAAALVSGPLCGVGLAAVVLLFGDVNPLGRTWYLRSFAFVGFVAGVISAIMIALIARPSSIPTSEQPADQDLVE